MPLLAFTDDLFQTWAADPECARLADRHYPRQKKGAAQFMPSGKKLVLRDAAGDVVFGWLWSPKELRADGEDGYNCTIFRNEGNRLASDIVLEAERLAVEKWGPNRAFTYIDPLKVPPTMVRSHPVWGFCYYKAGWHYVRLSKEGKHLLAKDLR